MAKGLPLRDLPQDSVNNCDGCQAGMELDEYGRHIIGGGTYMACSKDRYSVEASKEEDIEQKWRNRLNILKENRAIDVDWEQEVYDQLIKQNAEFIRDLRKQKEKDAELIRNLLEIVNVLSATIDPNNYTREFKSKVRDSITKAEKY